MRTDAERVSDIVAGLRAGVPHWQPEHAYEERPNVSAANIVMAKAADIIEAQSKALAEARETLAKFGAGAGR